MATATQEQIKFTEEEIKKITDLQVSYSSVTAGLGQLKVQEINIQQEIDKLTAQYINLGEQENVLIAELNKKYGDGTLDLDTGTFTPKQ